MTPEDGARRRVDRYRVPSDVPRSRLGGGHCASYDPFTERAFVLSPAEAAIVAACGGWGTVDELSARAAGAGVPATRAAIGAALVELAERGVLTPESDVLARLCAGASPTGSGAVDGGGAAIASIGIPTRGRPEALRRALASYARDIADSGRAIEIVVADDAGGDDADRSREIVRDVARRFGVRARHADRAARARFAAEVAALAGVDPAVARAGLAPDETSATFSAGASRNALLLAAAGTCALQADDDTVCDPRAAPALAAALALRSFEDPTEIWFDGGSGGSGEARPGVAALHERLLGGPAAAIVARAVSESGVDLARASTGLLGKIAAGGRVACTQLGLRGDSGMGTMGYLLTLGQPSRGRLLASEPTYREAVEARRLTRAVTAETLTDQELCMTYAIGLDARVLLPPFPAAHRNEDGLFGAVLVACEPSAVFGHLPVTIGHEPEEPRRRPFEHVLSQAGLVGANDVVAGLVALSRSDVDTRSPARAMESLGSVLVAWTKVPAPEVFERIWWMLARRLAQRLSRIDMLLREASRAPAFWARDLDALADAVRARAEEPERAVPVEWEAERDRDAARAHALDHVRAYGELLAAWPALSAAAATLRDRGIQLGESVA
jgi:hypothetical protein